MPIYEYRCGACGHELDALQKLADDPLRDCPECEKPQLKRLMSAPAFRLKGGGWYETDFKSDKEKKRNLADGGEGKVNGKAASADSGKSESKSADKAAEPKKKDASAKTAPSGSGTAAA